MSIESELERLNTAKTDIAAAIQQKGVIVPELARLSDYRKFVDMIVTGFRGTGCTAHLSTDMSNVNANDVTIPLGKMLTSYGGAILSNGGIKILEPGYYAIDGQIMINEGASNLYLGMGIRSEKHGFISDAYTRYANNYGILSTSMTIVELELNDIVYLVANCEEAVNGVKLSNSTRTKLTLFRVF